MPVTTAEYQLRRALARLPTDPEGSAILLRLVEAETCDRRLGWRVAAVLEMLRRHQTMAAQRQLRRALDYETRRRAGRGDEGNQRAAAD